MYMHSLIEHNNYSDTSGCLWQLSNPDDVTT